MERRDNYALQAAYARELFLQYDARILARKLNSPQDDTWLYTAMFGERYRIHLTSGHIFRFHGNQWLEADSFSETLTLLDLVCDSRGDRHISGQWKNVRDFGLQFHRTILEDTRDPWAERFQNDIELFHKVCRRMQGVPYPFGDVSYRIPVFEDLSILIQFWFGDDEFPPSLRWLWDSNALMYIKYETMYYAVDLLKKRFEEAAKESQI